MATTGKCFLVTGPPGIGKTTLVMKVLESLKISHPTLKVQGFYTRMVASSSLLISLQLCCYEGVHDEIRGGNNERVGFEVLTLDGRRGRLASTTISSAESLRWPAVGKYKVDIASFESLALPELQIKEDTDLFIIDEVGKMELFSSSFFPAVLKILESNIPLLATIPIPRFGRDIPGGIENSWLAKALFGRAVGMPYSLFRSCEVLRVGSAQAHFNVYGEA
ncbi:hypothetical protein ACLOJK_018434 [Asimina triloba]